MNDPEIRALLIPRLVGGLVIDELPVGHTVGCMTRADLVHIGSDFMHGYELKGDNDTLKRVPMQLACYGSVFDRVTFVVTSKHSARILLPKYGFPEWAGLSIVNFDGTISEVFPAKPVPTLSRAELGCLLWQAELLEFLKAHGVPVLSRHRVWECREMLESPAIALDDLRVYVRERLAKRYASGCRLRDKRAAHAAKIEAPTLAHV